MREYKFRGKRKDNGEWIYGYLRKTGYENIEKTNGQYIKTIKYYQIQDQNYNSKFIDEETVGQYTEQKDKNGKEIYEGDIIKDCDYGIMICKFINGSFVWLSIKNMFYIKFFSYIPNIEVMGNIVDNPELLKESN